MLETIFLAINSWILDAGPLAFVAAFLWGLVAMFFSPCHLAAIPLMIAYVGGQRVILPPGKALRYAVAFSGGIFLSIVLVGVICAGLGRMLGDVGPWWRAAVGGLLLWVGGGMFGAAHCGWGGYDLARVRLTGVWGAFILGLGYGVLSGACTFGFLAPILGIISVQKKIVTGVTMVLLFATGLCLPLVVAGTFSALVGRALAGHAWQTTSLWFRRLAGLVIIGLGFYFLAGAFW